MAKEGFKTMIPGFNAVQSFTKTSDYQMTAFKQSTRIVPAIHECPPCTPCVGGEQTCFSYNRADDACEPYSQDCPSTPRTCSERLRKCNAEYKACIASGRPDPECSYELVICGGVCL